MRPTTDDAPRPSPQESGIGAADVKKLVDAGVHTVEGLARSSRRRLAEIRGLSEQKVEKLKQIGASSEVNLSEDDWKSDARRTRSWGRASERERERERERCAARGTGAGFARRTPSARARRETRGERGGGVR